jgi:hypothetical protein
MFLMLAILANQRLLQTLTSDWHKTSQATALMHRAISCFSCTFLAVLFSSFVCLAFFRLSSVFLVVLVL